MSEESDADLTRSMDESLRAFPQIDRHRLTELVSRVQEYLTDIDESVGFLLQSVQKLGAHGALDLLESIDLQNFVRRVLAMDRLPITTSAIRPDPPMVHPIEDEPFTAMISHLEDNRKSLIATGYPKCSFAQFQWLDVYLTKLYPTKLPVATQCERSPFEQSLSEQDGDADRDAEGNLIYSFTWAKRREKGACGKLWHRTTDRHEQADAFSPTPVTQPLFMDCNPVLTIGGFDWRDNYVLTADGFPVEPCPYSDAPTIPGMYGADATRIETLREIYLNAKLVILSRIQTTVKGGSFHQLTDAVLHLLVESFAGSRDDLCFLHQMDGKYRDFFSGTQRNPLADETVRDFWHGGVDDLLIVTGWCEHELRTEYRKKLVEILGDIGKVTPPGTESYYSSIDRGWQPDLDECLDRFTKLESEKVDFWKDHRMCIDDFFDSTTVPPPGETETAATPVEESESPYRVIQQKGGWVIVYDGINMLPLSDSKAHQSLMKILTTPAREGVTAKSWIRGSKNPHKLLAQHIETALADIDALATSGSSEQQSATRNLYRHLEENIPHRSAAVVRYTGDLEWELEGSLRAFQRADKRRKTKG